MFDTYLRNSLEQALSLQFNRSVEMYDFKSVAGGCINYSACIDTSMGHFFVKINDPDLYPDMFEKEARGLELLASTKTINIPKTINHGIAGKYSFLVLDYVQPSSRNDDFWEQFGASLAEMHKRHGHCYGLDHDNYIGSLKQSNNQHDDWTVFFVEERLKRQMKLAFNNGYLNVSHDRQLENLFKELHNIFPKEPPSLLHGDMWSGNFIIGEDGYACVFDPAVYYGNRESEIAFTALFGGFDEAFYKGYNAVYPLEKDFESRKDIYNLYPLMVHLNLFGTSYLSRIESILGKYSLISP